MLGDSYKPLPLASWERLQLTEERKVEILERETGEAAPSTLAPRHGAVDKQNGWVLGRYDKSVGQNLKES